MDTARVITAICRLAAVLVVAGVVAMHGVTSGHHAGLPTSGAQAMIMSDTVMGVPVSSDTVTSDISGGPALPGTLVQVCLAILMMVTTILLGPLARTRRGWPGATASGGRESRWAPPVPDPRAPCLLALGVLRT